MEDTMRNLNTKLSRLMLFVVMAIAATAIDTAAATFTVTNNLNTGAGSLRQAVTDSNAAAGSDTIVFDAVVFSTPQTIALASVITLNPATGDSLTIIGPGVNLLTVDGNDGVSTNVRIFTVSSGDTVSISGMTLTNGGDGAIDNSGLLTVTDMAFPNNTNGNGGAIATGGASLTITNCTFSGNTATSGSATGLGGGAIYQSATGAVTTISDSTFTNNSEVGGSGGGGAIRNRTGTMNISNTTFIGNNTVVSGGAIVNSETMTISGSTFSGNAATGTGGAIYTSGITLAITSTLMDANTAGTDGGAIFTNSGSSTDVINSTLSNNIANADNGATGSGRGGAIYNEAAMTVAESTIRGNQAQGTASTRGIAGAIYGAGGTLTLTNSTVSGNTAGQLGGALYLTGTAGAITNVDSCTLVENISTGAGGGVVRASTTNPVNLKNSIFANNTDNGTAPNVQGAVVSQGYNLIEVTTGATITGDTATNITGQDPNLGPLQDNGGVTFTHALLPASPAIDKGIAGSLTSDQRQQTRFVDDLAITNAAGGDGADIGAYEIQPILQFSSATYSVSEDGGTATITVARINGSEGVDSINYATSDGTATGGAVCGGDVDYQSASGTLTFNGGDLSQTFTVTLCPDSLFKSDETINLTLSLPIGATLGTPAVALLTILNDDTPTPTSTNTFTPTNTATNTATSTATNTATNTPTFTPTATFTPSNTSTNTPTSTATNTSTPTPTASPVISGVVTYGNAIPAATRFVSNVLMTGVGSPNVSTTTSFPGGTYSLSGFGAGSYTVTPTKTGAVNGAISSFDAAKIAQHASATVLLTGNQLLVADTSNNGNISSFDAAQVALYTVASPPYGLAGSWKFLPVNRAYSSVNSILTDENYSALLMGEVSGNWTNSAARPATGPERGIVVSAPDLATPADDEVIIPVTVQGAMNKGVIAYEFDLRYDPTVIQPQADPVGVAGTASRGMSIAVNAKEAGILRVAVYGTLPLDENGLLLNLKFDAVGAPGAVSPLTWERLMFNEGDPAVTPADGQIDLSAAAPNSAEITGRLVDPIGQGIPNTRVALVDMTGRSRSIISNGFGFYRFGKLQVGQTYTISVGSKDLKFTPLTVSVTGQLLNVDMIADQ